MAEPEDTVMQSSIILTTVLHYNAVAAATLVLAVILAPLLYCLYFHPLRHIPGPLLARVTPLFLYTICYIGIEGHVLLYYHQKYKTKVLRVAPNSVSISDSDAIRNIYVTNGGFPKDARYTNFNLGPVVSIFSAIDTEYRNTRAKAVSPLFAPARLRAASESRGVIGSYVAEFVGQLRAFKIAGVKVDVVDLSARLSIDVVTGYLLGERYGGLGEYASLSLHDRQKTKLSANPFIFAIVAFSRFSLLPNWLFRIVYTVSSWINSSDEVVRSFVQLDQFVDRVMGNMLEAKDRDSASGPADTTYQGRLLQAGISPIEAAAQSKAIVFAGADSTAVMLTTILFHLVDNADARARLLREIRSSNFRATTSKNQDTSAALTDPQALPYLRAVVKEGLRLGMANPTRLTRVVPATGLQIGAIHLPMGTVVGCAAYMLHHDPDVFPDPFAFRPERWLEDGQDEGLIRPDMEKSMIPFGAGLRACIGKNLAQQQVYETVLAVVDSEVLEGARTCQQRIEMIEWFNGEIKGHHLEIEWLSE